MKKIVLTGGGTAGHVTPHIALIPKLRENNLEIHYIGTKKGIERDLITKENVPYHSIAAGKLRRYLDLKNATDIFKIGLGFIQAFLILLIVRPNVVFSKGGFVSCPVVWASWLLRIPVVIHESDITPGLANKLSIPFATRICYSFPETAKHVSKTKGVHTGLPVRQALLLGSKEKGRELCKLANEKPVIMIMGGSQGSQAINQVIRDSLDALLESFNICHICGKGGLTKIDKSGYAQFEYVNEELPNLFAATDIVVCRSGATTLFELLALGKPSLLIPLPMGASRGDQILNARSFESHGWSKVLQQEELTVEELVSKVKETYENRVQMTEAIKSGLGENAIDAVYAVISQFVK